MATPMNKKDISCTQDMNLRMTNSIITKSYSSHIFTKHKIHKNPHEKTKTKIAKRAFYPQSFLVVNLEQH